MHAHAHARRKSGLIVSMMIRQTIDIRRAYAHVVMHTMMIVVVCADDDDVVGCDQRALTSLNLGTVHRVPNGMRRAAAILDHI